MAETGSPPAPQAAFDAAPDTAAPLPYLNEELDALSLHFSSEAVQSRMSLGDPTRLEIEYTRIMLATLLFVPQPRQIALLGLGGGSLPKFCHRHLPRSQLCVVEINPHVIALRNAFRIPPDDDRLQVLCEDGAHFVAHTESRFDTLWVDAFDAHGLPPALGTRRFFDDCHDILRPGGMLALNLHAADPLTPVVLGRLGLAFSAEVLEVTDADAGNCIAFARRSEPLRCAPAAALRCPAGLAPAAWPDIRAACARVATALQQGHNPAP